MWCSLSLFCHQVRPAVGNTNIFAKYVRYSREVTFQFFFCDICFQGAGEWHVWPHHSHVLPDGRGASAADETRHRRGQGNASHTAPPTHAQAVAARRFLKRTFALTNVCSSHVSFSKLLCPPCTVSAVLLGEGMQPSFCCFGTPLLVLSLT